MKTGTLAGIIAVLLLTLPVSASDYTLGIFGNANGDETINLEDVEYAERIVLGLDDQNQLADAKYDDKIDILDVTRIELIILGEEKELTLIDSADRIVTVNKPVNRVVALGGYDAEVMRMFGMKDKIVGVAYWFPKQSYYKVCLPELSELPAIGGWGANLDYEAILDLNPDLVTKWSYNIEEVAEHLPVNYPLACFEFYVPENMEDEVIKFGYIFNRKDEAKHYFDDFHDKYIDLIKEQTGELSEDERPKVYLERFEAYRTYGGDSYADQGISIAGGKNIFSDVGSDIFTVDAEDVVVRNPDIIIQYAKTAGPETGYDVDDISKAKALREKIMNRPELANVNAVKSGRVYIMVIGVNLGPKRPIANAYWAKWFQPELFVDLDPNAIHKEYLSYQGIEYNLDKHGVFVYHPEEHPHGT